MSAPSWGSTDREPVISTMSVHGNMALDGFADLWVDNTNPVEILSLEVLFCRLYNEPDFGLLLHAHVTQFDSNSHFLLLT